MRKLVDRYRVTSGKGFKLKHHDPSDIGGNLIDHHESETLLAAGVQRLSHLQNLLYPQNSWALLCVFQAMDAITIVLRGALRGAKDVRVVAIIGIGVAWLCIPSAAYLLGIGMRWGALGGWCGFVAETSLAASLFWWRWTRGAWRNAYAVDPSRAPTPQSTPRAAVVAAA